MKRGERAKETVDSERREREARGEYCEAKKQDCKKSVVQNWTQSSSWTRRAEQSSKAAKQYTSFREMVQPVREKEGGVAALAAVW